MRTGIYSNGILRDSWDRRKDGKDERISPLLILTVSSDLNLWRVYFSNTFTSSHFSTSGNFLLKYLLVPRKTMNGIWLQRRNESLILFISTDGNRGWGVIFISQVCNIWTKKFCQTRLRIRFRVNKCRLVWWHISNRLYYVIAIVASSGESFYLTSYTKTSSSASFFISQVEHTCNRTKYLLLWRFFDGGSKNIGVAHPKLSTQWQLRTPFWEISKRV
jgi:hypothetical protein